MLRALSSLGYLILLALSLSEVLVLVLPLAEHLARIRPIFLLL